MNMHTVHALSCLFVVFTKSIQIFLGSVSIKERLPVYEDLHYEDNNNDNNGDYNGNPFNGKTPSQSGNQPQDTFFRYCFGSDI